MKRPNFLKSEYHDQDIEENTVKVLGAKSLEESEAALEEMVKTSNLPLKPMTAKVLKSFVTLRLSARDIDEWEKRTLEAQKIAALRRIVSESNYPTVVRKASVELGVIEKLPWDERLHLMEIGTRRVTELLKKRV